ncbi:MAG: cytochrome C [Armatimonadota bacterium]|nr:cytochrome C [Armatimonadota bacterium]MDR7551554.1 cytochrome C [Armatimonadota bacterium]
MVPRFTLAQRIEHFVLIISFNVLALTGLPQKYFQAAWAERIIQVLGGIEQVRFIHRTFAVILIAEAVFHVGAVIVARRRGRERGEMNVSFQDVRDVVGDIAYLVGLRPTKPAFARFDYRQKLEYWAVVWGTAVMATSGLIMWFPEALARVLPGVLVPAARVAHGGEALLAVLAVIIWHFYNAHFRPDVFPLDPAMWTGAIPLERLRHDHRAEYLRLLEAGLIVDEDAAGVGGPEDTLPEPPSRA